MATGIRVKKKSGYVSQVKGRLLVFTPETIHQVVDGIPETEDLGFAREINGRLAIFTPETILEMVNHIQEKEKPNYVSEAHGQIKICTPEVIHQIVDHIQETEATAPVFGEILWSRRLAAKPYAQELFDAALRRKQLDRCHSDLNKAVQLSKDRDMVAFLEDPEVRFQDKARLLSERMGDKNYLVLNLIYRLLTKRMLDMLPDIADEYRRLFDSYDGIVRAQVTTAISLDEEDKLKISKRLGKIFGKKVILEPVVDPGIIGGIVVRVGDKLLDGSIRSKLESLKREMVWKI